ncbi:MAG: alkaline phosphatase family protein [Bacilli bacterium]|nr:alkaline phosphatase family protein [Bacilli bacterium]
MNKIDYTNSIVNLSNSILKHFDVDTFHNSIPKIDELIKDKKKVLVFLFDGMGKAVLNKHLDEKSFFRSHIVHEMYSTFPPTTVASTNGFLSGKTPIENGWLGWTLYFKDINKNVNVFPNEDDETGESIGKDNIMKKMCPFKDIAELINEKNNKEIARIYLGYPVDKENKKLRHVSSFVKYAFNQTELTDESFTYAYWVDPDMTMHRKGVTNKKVHRRILKIQKLVEKYSSLHKDIAVLIIADHGMIDVTFEDMNKHQDLVSMLSQPMSIEKRCINFYIKDEYKKDFPILFNSYYKEHYEIYSMDEVLNNKFFGDGTPHPMTKEFLGDYIAIAKDGFSLECVNNEKHKVKFKAHHAGNSLDELMISIIGINLD